MHSSLSAANYFTCVSTTMLAMTTVVMWQGGYADDATACVIPIVINNNLLPAAVRAKKSHGNIPHICWNCAVTRTPHLGTHGMCFATHVYMCTCAYACMCICVHLYMCRCLMYLILYPPLWGNNSLLPCPSNSYFAPPAGLEPAIFGLEVRRLVH
jgi:hypothetical protein